MNAPFRQRTPADVKNLLKTGAHSSAKLQTLADFSNEFLQTVDRAVSPLLRHIETLQELIESHEKELEHLRVLAGAISSKSGGPAGTTRAGGANSAGRSSPESTNTLLNSVGYKRFAKFYQEEELEGAYELYDEEHRSLDRPVYKSGSLTPAGEKADKKKLVFTMSSPETDRMGDVIASSAWDLRAFRKNPIALFSHNHNLPIGHWANVRVNRDGNLTGELRLAKKGTSKIVDEVTSLLDQGILRAVSVGFKPLKHEPIKDASGNHTGGYRFTRVQLLETSVVSVPAHQSALRVSE